MTTTTPELGLVLYDSSTDQAVLFSDYRAQISGTAATSNFYKIDTSIAGINDSLALLGTAKGAYRVASTYSAPNTYVATVASYTAYTTNDSIILSVDTTTSGTTTLNINSLGAKSLMKVDSSGAAINLLGSDLCKGRFYLFTYDGSRWIWVSANTADQIFVAGTSGNFLKVNASNNMEDSGSNASTFAVAAKGVTNGDTHDHIGGDGNAIAEGAFSFTDVTTANASTSAHGLMPKIPAAVSLTGSTTLTSTNLSDSLASLKWNVCTGSVDYTLTLPATSGISGKYLAIRMGNLADLSCFVILDGNASETIDGSLTRIMWANESCILVNDGSNWYKVAGKTVPLVAKQTASTTQTISHNTVTTVTLGTSTYDNQGTLNDTGNNRIMCRRNGLYDINGLAKFGAFSAESKNTQLTVRITGTGSTSDLLSVANTYFATLKIYKPSISLTTSDYVDLTIYQNSGVNETTVSASPELTITEIPTW